MKTAWKVLASSLLAVSFLCAAGDTPAAQTGQRPLPKLVHKDGRYALFVDGAPYLMLGAQTGNSSNWPAMLPKVWPAIQYLHANTVEIPVYWEVLEPQQGHFDFTSVDLLLTQAREHKVHLVLLWFGTWKNGSQHYMPEWMKLGPVRYPHVIDKNGHAMDSPSPYAPASLEADTKAFTALMRHLKAADPQRTVIMVQVENEPGTWGGQRDYGPAAQKLFDAPVPEDVLKAMGKPAATPAPKWADAFGPEADVNFHAWSVAKYIGQVAAAGKAAYPLPHYANAALRDPIKPGAPGSYEAGGPTDNVISIWKVAAPAIDIEAPDIYMSDSTPYLKVLELYHRDDNALFVPETGGGVARFFFSALGLQTIGFSPFGLDYTNGENEERLKPFADVYRLISPMMREIARLNFEGKLQAVAEEKDKPTQTLQFGAWNATLSYGAARNGRANGNATPTGRALVAQLKDNQFLVCGMSSRVDFRPADAGPDKHRQFLRVEEGAYDNGVFKPIRILNGDQTDYGLNFNATGVVLRVSLATY